MFLQALEAQISREPELVAAIAGDRPVTYAEVARQSGSLAVWFARQGLRLGDPVALTVRDEYRHLIAALALLRLGCPHVTLPSGEPLEYRRSLAARVASVALIAEEAGYALADVPLIQPDFDFFATPEEIAALPLSDHDAVALYLTSSGTTGRAKFIPTSYRQLHRQGLDWQWPGRRDVLYRPNTIEFNNSKRQRLYVLLWGSTNVMVDAARVDILETCRRWNVTRLNIGALQARVLIERADRRRLPDTIDLRLGGSAVNARLRAEIVEYLTPKLHVTYATSEFGSIATAGPAYHATHSDGLGTVHPGVTLEIVDSEDRPVADGVPGQIRVKGEGMPTRYHDDAAATAKAFRGGWFYPGDLGHRDEEGYLHFDGRADDMLNLASINIFPAEIERVVEALPGVVESAVFAMRSEEFGDIPLLAAVVRPGLTAADIQAYARQKLGLRAPRKVYLVDALPRNSGGKIMRERLRELVKAPAPRERQ